MSAPIKLLLALAIVAGSAAAWLVSAWDRATLRYKLTYEVEVDGALRSGSGVVEVTREDTTKLPLPMTGYGYAFRGEAPVVDLGGGRYLFSLLTDSSAARTDAPYLPYTVFAAFALPGDTPVETTRRLMARKPQAVLMPEQVPLLVTLTDVNDPRTVRKVDPANLAASFGAGVKLARVTLAITDEAVTQGRVENVLEWLGALNGGYLHGGSTSRGAPLGLYGGNFVKQN
jgi:hypothetical protein